MRSVLEWCAYGLERIWLYALDRPVAFLLIVLAFLQLFGTTVRTGWVGIVFRWGRVARKLEPGFHWLIPWVERAKKIRATSVTIDAAKQRLTSADDRVYHVDANLVFRVVDPYRALIEIDDPASHVEVKVWIALHRFT